jgi:GxxExxY protein
MTEENAISTTAIGLAIEIHRTLGPGLLESVYKECLFHRLCQEGFQVEKEVSLPLEYEGIRLENTFRMDLLINDKVIVEVKSVAGLLPIHTAQALTYVRLSGKRLALILNFNEVLMKNGIKRVILSRTSEN